MFEPNILTPYEKLTYNESFDSGTHKGQVTDFNFPTFLISKRGEAQNDSAKLTQKNQIALTVKVNFTSNTETIIYNNSEGKLINMVNQFANYNYGTEIIVNLETKEFKKR